MSSDGNSLSGLREAGKNPSIPPLECSQALGACDLRDWHWHLPLPSLRNPSVPSRRFSFDGMNYPAPKLEQRRHVSLHPDKRFIASKAQILLRNVRTLWLQSSWAEGADHLITAIWFARLFSARSSPKSQDSSSRGAALPVTTAVTLYHKGLHRGIAVEVAHPDHLLLGQTEQLNPRRSVLDFRGQAVVHHLLSAKPNPCPSPAPAGSGLQTERGVEEPEQAGRGGPV